MVFIRFFKTKVRLLILFCLVATVANSQNLLVNGDFESGGNGVGFSLNGSGYNLIAFPFSGTTAPGNYAFTTNPQPMNTTNFIVGGDHTSSTGNMMIIDGNTTGGAQRFWRAGSSGGGVCTLTVGVTYTFSYWIKSVSNTVIDAATRADIGIQFNNVSSYTLVSGNAMAPMPALGWQQVVYTFVPSNACVNIELWNNNTNPVGNDFAVDDFSVTAPPQPLSVMYSYANSTCFGTNNGSITVYGVGGITPYASYSISGTSSVTNANGIFTSLAPGTYNVSVTDNAGATATYNGVVVSQPSNLTVGATNTSFCAGGTTTLNASGGSTYTWTASPADTTLTATTSASPTVSPTQTTTYTVTSTTTSTTDLIFNGNFSQGNAGFSSDYLYLNPTNVSGAQRAYGIVANSNSWYSGFSSCTDHTSATGNMMVFDGSNFNSGNDKLWCQTVAVVPGQNYTFRYWIQTVATPNSANIDVVINGTSVGMSLAPATTCGWVQLSYVWNSGASTSAQIFLYDRNTAVAGNDFAIDDISFTTTTTCNLSNSVTINVNPTLTPTVNCATTTATTIPFNWTAVTGATAYTVSYSVNGGTIVNAGSVVSTTFTVSSLSAGDSVAITVLPTGSGCFAVGTQTCSVSSCPLPVASVTVQPTCTVPTGTVVVTSPLNVAPLPIPTDLFISEVTDEDVGALTYVEIYNGTGSPKNLANYKLKIYNNGNTFTSCEFPLVGALNNNDVYVLSVGSVVNQGGVTPDLVVSSCAGVNNNDNIRLTSSADVEIDLWGRTDGVAFTPSSLPGYTYRRLATAPHPTTIWNAVDWTAIDPQDYTNVGTYLYQTALYEYSVNGGTTYQSGTTFAGLAPGTYNVVVRDLASGCVSNTVSLTVNAVPTIVAPTITVTQPSCSVTTGSIVVTAPIGANLQYSINGSAYQSGTTFSGLVANNYNVMVQDTSNGCVSSATPVTITAFASVPAPTVTSPVTYCQNATATTLTATPSTGGTLNWYGTNATGGTASATAPTPSITTLGSTTYYVSQTVGGCEGPRAPIVVTVSAAGTPLNLFCDSTLSTPTSIYFNFSNVGQTNFTYTYSIAGGPPVTGTWVSPFHYIVSGLSTGQSVTFTISANGVACVNPETVTCNTACTTTTTPNFAAIAPICLGGTVPVLVTTSPNGVVGTWLPSVISNTASGSYVFTPNATLNPCATTQTLNVTITTPVTPTFTSVAAICSGATLAALPTTSTNGITGSWSPALNNTVTTTYTFTPSAGQCATTATLTITVNSPTIVPTFAAVAPICSGVTLSALPTTSTNGITGSWSPALNNTITTTYTFTPTPGLCATTTTLTIIVNSVLVVPTFTQVAPICFGTTSPSLPTISNNGITGSWSPIMDNTLTTTYTFTPASGQCATTTTMTVQVEPAPIVNTPTPLQFCDPNNDGFGNFDLTQVINAATGGNSSYTVSFHETLTDAQVGGTSIPNPSNYYTIDINSQVVYIRVESNTSSCYSIVQLQLIVNPTPEAVTPADYHQCDNDYDHYTVFDLTSLDSTILGGMSAATHTVAYYTSLSDAQTGLNPISNVTSYTNAIADIQQLWAVVTITATGCTDMVTFNIVVDPLPQAIQPAYPSYSLCETPANGVGYESFDLQSQESSIMLETGVYVTFYPSLLDAQNGTNAITNTTGYVNTAIYVQTLGVRITNSTTNCYVISTMDIRVNPLPTPIAPTTPLAVCDTNQDGLSTVNLCSLTTDILQGANYLISYHETQTDALNNANPLPCLYTNISGFVQYLWVGVEDSLTGCRTAMQIEINVYASPIIPPLTTLTLCDTDSNTQNGMTMFNLELQTPIILAAQTSSASNYTVSYYTNQANAEATPIGINPIVSTTHYVGSNGQIIWVRVENNVTGCFESGSFQLVVNAPLSLTTPTPLKVCDDDSAPNDLHTTFDLTVKDNEITTGLPGYTVTYYPSSPVTSTSVAIADPTAYVNVSNAVQTLGVMVSSPAGCKSYTTLDIRVLPVPVPKYDPPTLPAQCENALNSGVQTFDLTTNSTYILNNALPTEVSLHYYYTEQDLIDGVNEIMTPWAALVGDPTLVGDPINLVQYVYIAVTSSVFSDSNSHPCYVIVKQGFIVNPLPQVATIPDYQICEEDPVSNDGFEVFDLTTQATALLAGNSTTPVSTYSIAYYTNASLTNQIGTPTAYTNTSNPQTIYVVVTNTITGCTSSVGQFNIKVNPKPDYTAPSTLLNTCDDDGTNDGYYAYPLDGAVTTEILNGQDPTQFTVTFYNSEYNPDALPPLLPTPIAASDLAGYMGYTHTIWAVVTNTLTGCYKIGSFAAMVEQKPQPVISTAGDVHTICVDYLTGEVVRELTLVASNTTTYLVPPAPSYTYQWYEDGQPIAGATSSTYTIDTAHPLNDTVSSTFTVQMTSTSALGCSDTSVGFDVNQSGQATPVTGTTGYTITNAFTDNQTIVVGVVGYGAYEYSLDDGPRQVSNIFENVPLGSHIVTVWDTEGGIANSCDPLIIEDVQTIDYPHYFTPNGDGIHETWNINGLSNQPSAKIYIFDRYGKLIKQISSVGQGWDGTYNGNLMPSTDYWFTVDYLEQSVIKQFKAHFSLKR